jgi:hypothetical protein
MTLAKSIIGISIGVTWSELRNVVAKQQEDADA